MDQVDLAVQVDQVDQVVQQDLQVRKVGKGGQALIFFNIMIVFKHGLLIVMLLV